MAIRRNLRSIYDSEKIITNPHYELTFLYWSEHATAYCTSCAELLFQATL